MVDIRERVEEDRGLLKRIQLVIPGFAGYRRREDLRTADNLLRIQVANKLKETRGTLEGARAALASNYLMKALEPMGVVMMKVQSLEGQIRHAEQGYSGLVADVKVLEPQLNKLYEWDAALLDAVVAPVIGPIMKLFGVKQEAQVYYLARRPFDGKFGSKAPYQFRDQDFGMVNLRLFGEFRYRIKEPSNFIHQFDPYGIEVQKISGLYITLPEAVQAAVDQRAAMQITGTNYMQYQTGAAMRDAATNPAGGAGTGIGLGAGIGMGYQMAGQMMQQPQGAPQQTKPCPKCGTLNPATMKFCGNCGARTEEGMDCPKCKTFVAKGTKFCPNCGNNMVATAKCANGHENPVGTKFCSECGAKVG